MKAHRRLRVGSVHAAAHLRARGRGQLLRPGGGRLLGAKWWTKRTGVSNKVVVDWRQQPRGSDLKPRVGLTDESGEIITLTQRHARRSYFLVGRRHPRLSRTARRSNAGDVLARIPRRVDQDPRHYGRPAARGRAVRGPPKPKDHAVITDITGRVEFGKDYKAKRRIVASCRTTSTSKPVGVLDPEGQAPQRSGRGHRAQGRPADGRQPRPARHPARATA